MARRIHAKIIRTEEEKAALRAARERYQRDKPTIEQALEEASQPDLLPLAVVLTIRHLATQLRKERERQQLSLSELARRAEMDPATLSRLETGQARNPTLDTL